MPVYKDEKRNSWYCKCNYKDWLMRRPATKSGCFKGIGDVPQQAFCIGYVSMHCLRSLYRIPHNTV